MARSAPLPKVGPKLLELKIAAFSSISCIFCFSDMENRKDYFFISECTVLFVDRQGMGVYPPITLLNSVLIKIIVSAYPSQYWWNLLTEKLLSEARYSILAPYILWGNSFSM